MAIITEYVCNISTFFIFKTQYVGMYTALCKICYPESYTGHLNWKLNQAFFYCLYQDISDSIQINHQHIKRTADTWLQKRQEKKR